MFSAKFSFKDFFQSFHAEFNRKIVKTLNANNMIINKLRKYPKKTEEKYIMTDSDKIPITIDLRGLET